MDNPLINAGIGVVILILASYACGRLHQWFRTTNDRELAYRDGYDTATKSLFSLAARLARNAARPMIRGAATVHSIQEARAEKAAETEVRKPSPRPRATAGEAGARHRATSTRKSVSDSETRRIYPDRMSA